VIFELLLKKDGVLKVYIIHDDRGVEGPDLVSPFFIMV